MMKTIAAMLAAGLAFAIGAEAQAAGVYSVAKVSVTADADNAVAAKERAIADAQQMALRVLLKRMTSWRSHAKLPVLTDDMVEKMVDGFSVRRESNSNTRYMATLDFNFEPNAVRDILNRFNIPYTDQQAAQLLLLPIMVEGGAVRPGTSNAWYQAMSGVDSEHSLTPAKLASPRDDVTAAMVSDIGTKAQSVFETLKYQYRSENLVLAVAEVDPNATQLRLRLLGQDAVGPFSLARSFRIPDRDVDYTAAIAAQVAVKVIEGRWKTTRLASQGAASGSADLETIALTAQFSGLKAWQEMRARLQKVPGVQALDVKTLNARGASITIDYPGGAARLAQAAQSQGLTLEQRGQEWLLVTR